MASTTKMWAQESLQPFFLDIHIDKVGFNQQVYGILHAKKEQGNCALYGFDATTSALVKLSDKERARLVKKEKKMPKHKISGFSVRMIWVEDSSAFYTTHIAPIFESEGKSNVLFYFAIEDLPELDIRDETLNYKERYRNKSFYLQSKIIETLVKKAYPKEVDEPEVPLVMFNEYRDEYVCLRKFNQSTFDRLSPVLLSDLQKILLDGFKNHKYVGFSWPDYYRVYGYSDFLDSIAPPYTETMFLQNIESFAVIERWTLRSDFSIEKTPRFIGVGVDWDHMIFFGMSYLLDWFPEEMQRSIGTDFSEAEINQLTMYLLRPILNGLVRKK